MLRKIRRLIKNKWLFLFFNFFFYIIKIQIKTLIILFILYEAKLLNLMLNIFRKKYKINYKLNNGGLKNGR